MIRRVIRAVITVMIGGAMALSIRPGTPAAQANLDRAPTQLNVVNLQDSWEAFSVRTPYLDWVVDIVSHSPKFAQPTAPGSSGLLRWGHRIMRNTEIGAAAAVDSDAAQFFVIDQGSALRASRGDPPGRTPQYHNLRALFPAYHAAVLFLEPLKPGSLPAIGDFSGLKDKTIGFGSSGSTTAWMMPEMLKALGIPFKAIDYSPYSTDSNNPRNTYDAIERAGLKTRGMAQGNRDPDAVAYITPAPLHPRFLGKFGDIGTPSPVLKVFAPGPKEKTNLLSHFKFLDFYTIPPGGLGTAVLSDGTTRTVNTATIRTLGLWYFAITNTSLPVCAAYWLVDAVMNPAAKSRAALPDDPKTTGWLADTTVENFKRIQFIPLHAGAALWMRDHHIPLERDQRADPTDETCR